MRDIVIGVIVIIVIVVGAVLYKKYKTEASPSASPTPQSTTKEDIQDMFNYQVPEDVESIELKDVSGGSAKAIATRNYENGTFSNTVLADLPDLSSGFYQGWLVRGSEGDSDYKIVSTGKLRVAKGGYLLDFSSSTNYSDYNTVWITKETNFDSTPETHILEASF